MELFLSCATSGAAGGLAVAALNPLDTLKVRYQVSTGTSIVKFGREIVATEGLVRGLWAPGITANALGIAISSMGRVGCYPYVRDLFGTSKAAMFFGGLLAGGMGYLASSPVYQIKTLAQAEAGLVRDGVLTTGGRAGLEPVHHTKSLFASLATLARKRSLFRGSSALVARGALLSAGQQLCYDGLKTEVRGLVDDGPALHVVASVAGAFGATLCSTPADVVMTKYQSFHYTSLTHCARSIFKEEGLLGFYRGFVPFFVRLSPVLAISLPLTEQLRRLCGLGYL